LTMVTILIVRTESMMLVMVTCVVLGMEDDTCPAYGLTLGRTPCLDIVVFTKHYITVEFSRSWCEISFSTLVSWRITEQG
jgi:hypothetical protein